MVSFRPLCTMSGLTEFFDKPQFDDVTESTKKILFPSVSTQGE